MTALRETGKWKEECLHITLFWHVPSYASWKFNNVSWRRIAKICNMYTYCYEKIKPLEERTFPLFVVLLLLNQYPVAQSRNKPLGLARPNKQITLWRRQALLINFTSYFLKIKTFPTTLWHSSIPDVNQNNEELRISILKHNQRDATLYFWAPDDERKTARNMYSADYNKEYCVTLDIVGCA